MKRGSRVRYLAFVGLLALMLDAAQEPNVSAQRAITSSHLIVAGDLDGDRRSDLLSLQPSQVAATRPLSGASTTITTLSGIRGSDGQTLWSYSEPGWGFPLAARVGRPPHDGAVLWTRGNTAGAMFCQPPCVGGQGAVLRLMAISGQGTPLWVRLFPEVWIAFAIGSGFLGAGFPFSTLDANGDGADDVVVATPLATNFELRGWQVEVISGTDGATLYSFVINTHRDPRIIPVADISRDGRMDYLLLEGLGEKALISARRGTDGVELWKAVEGYVCVNHRGEHLCSEALADLGDITGDGIRDFAIKSRFYGRRPLTTRIAVLNGANGKRLWERINAGAAYGAGDVNGDGVRDVGLQLFRGCGRFSCPFPSKKDGRWRVVYEAVDARGRTLYSKPQTHPVTSRCARCEPFFHTLGSVGDIDGDGSAEAGHFVTLHTATGVALIGGAVVSGKTGKRNWILNSGPFGPVTLGQIQSTQFLIPIGRAQSPAYFLNSRREAGGLLLTALRAADGKILWTSRIRLAPREDLTPFSLFSEHPLVPNADLTGDGRPDLVLNLGVPGPNDQGLRSVVINGANGRPLH